MAIGVALLLAVLIVLPLLWLVGGSVAGPDGFTIGYFEHVLSNPLYLRALLNSLELGGWTALFSVLIGAPLAWAVARTDLPAKRFVKLTASLAYLSPPFLLAIAYVTLLSPNAGIINAFLRETLGLPGLVFNIFSMAGMVLVTVPHTFPFVYLLSHAALGSIDASLEESAEILGAGKVRTALGITLPLVAPAIIAGTLIGFVNAIALFGSQAIIGLPASIFTLPTRIYTLFDFPPQLGLASALSLILVAITVLALTLQRSYLARRGYVTIAGRGTGGSLVRLGALRWPLFGFCLLVFVAAILLPYGALLAVSLSKSWGLAFWQNLTLANYRFVLFEYEPTGRAILNSLGLAAVAASLCACIGALIAWIDLRTRLAGRRMLDYVALIPLGLPGIVMAVALLRFWLSTPAPLYGTLTILLLAYTARYLPLGVRAANAGLRQIDPSLEESAQILGAGRARTWWEVTLPLIRPSLFAGWFLVFVPSIQELSASILLFSSDSITLAVAVYNLYENGSLEAVAALSIVNMAIIGAAIALADRLSRGSAAISMAQAR